MDGQVIDVFKPVLVDAIVFSILGLFNLYVAQFMKPTQRGFFCDDDSIRYPALNSTVPAVILNIVGIVVPLASIVFFELKDTHENKRRGPTYMLGSHKLKMTYWNVFQMVACYGSGAIFSQLLTDVGKKVVGRLRPNFLDVCRPDLEKLCQLGEHKLISDYTCSADTRIVDKSRVSFPSGHSSFSFYVAIFLVLYLQKKLKVRTLLLKPIIQFLIVLLAWFVALSRVMNNKHHWSDVLSGILLGSGVAIINTVFVHRIFSSKKIPSASSTLSIQNANNAHEVHDQL